MEGARPDQTATAPWAPGSQLTLGPQLKTLTRGMLVTRQKPNYILNFCQSLGCKGLFVIITTEWAFKGQVAFFLRNPQGKGLLLWRLD